MSAIKNNKQIGYYKPEQYTTSKIIILDVLGNQVVTKNFEKQSDYLKALLNVLYPRII